LVAAGQASFIVTNRLELEALCQFAFGGKAVSDLEPSLFAVVHESFDQSFVETR
jgi:hypothetical protein